MNCHDHSFIWQADLRVLATPLSAIDESQRDGGDLEKVTVG